MGKAIAFLMFIFAAVTIAGNVMQGQTDFVRVHLTAAISDSDTTITVSSTEGFPDTGIIVIEDEHISYSSKTATTFKGNLARPLNRGVEGTEAQAHTSGAQVTTKPGMMLNASADYNIATIADSSGLMAFVSVPLALFALLGSFLFLPIQFLGTDLQILTFLWAIVGISTLAALTIVMAGGRRV